MNSRELGSREPQNLACLDDAGLASVVLFATETGLSRGIRDATELFPGAPVLHQLS